MKLKQVADDDESAEYETVYKEPNGADCIRPIKLKEKSNAEIANQAWLRYEKGRAGKDCMTGFAESLLDAVDAKIKKAREGAK